MRETVTRDAGQLSIPFVQPARRLPHRDPTDSERGFSRKRSSFPPSLPLARLLTIFHAFRILSFSFRLLEQNRAKSYLFIFIPAINPEDYAN